MNSFLVFVYRLAAVVLALTFHEFSHAAVSTRLGDPTAKAAGRLTLDPRSHIDIWGALFMIIFGFGWARPVPISPGYYKSPRRDVALVSLAGPLANILLAVCSMLFVKLIYAAYYMTAVQTVCALLLSIAELNFFLGIFNLLPIPPLDGGKVLYALLPDRIYRRYLRYEAYGFAGVLLLLAVSRIYQFSLTTWIDTAFYWLFNRIL